MLTDFPRATLDVRSGADDLTYRVVVGNDGSIGDPRVTSSPNDTPGMSGPLAELAEDCGFRRREIDDESVLQRLCPTTGRLYEIRAATRSDDADGQAPSYIHERGVGTVFADENGVDLILEERGTVAIILLHLAANFDNAVAAWQRMIERSSSAPWSGFYVPEDVAALPVPEQSFDQRRLRLLADEGGDPDDADLEEDAAAETA